MSLLAECLDDANLFSAWQKVRSNGGAAGVDGHDLDAFGVNVFGRLQTIREQVMRQEYRPKPLLQVAIPKDNGKIRYLAIPTVRDRVLQTAVTRVLSPELDREFEHASYAYRAGRSVQMAVARVAHYRDQGFQWVVDADIQAFFDEVSHSILVEKLRRTLVDHSLIPLIELWLAAIIQPVEGQQYLLQKGIPQGSPLSPLMANLYLDDFDEALLGENLRLVRFADDFLILCRDQEEAEAALDLTEEVIDGLQLRLNADKTRITSFEEGFKFLGVDFIRNLMEASEDGASRWVLPTAEQRQEAADLDVPDDVSEDEPEEGAAEEASASSRLSPDEPSWSPVKRELSEALDEELPLQDLPALEDADNRPGRTDEWEIALHNDLSPCLRSLYVTVPGASLLKEHERVVLAQKKEVLLSWPLGKLDEIVIQENALVSTALMQHCAKNGIAISIQKSDGRFSCSVSSGDEFKRLDLVRAQVEAAESAEFGLMVAVALIDGKIANQRTLLRRYNRRREIREVELAQLLMAEQAKKLHRAKTLDEVRGHEGLAAKTYFGALGRFLGEDWGFQGRNKRPPRDPVNAMLSLGYGILHNTVQVLLQRQSLLPYMGMLHMPRPGHMALASDLMEEFRAPVVDAVVLQMVLEGLLQPSDFSWEDDDFRGCTLKGQPRKLLVESFAKKLRSGLVHPDTGTKMDYHRAILYQVNLYRRVLLREEKVYRPFKIR